MRKYKKKRKKKKEKCGRRRHKVRRKYRHKGRMEKKTWELLQVKCIGVEDKEEDQESMLNVDA